MHRRSELSVAAPADEPARTYNRTMTERALVTGGTGLLGVSLARSLMDAGDQVSISGRDFSRSAELVELGARPITADLGDFEATAASVEGHDAVYHCGALSAPWGRTESFHQVN